MGSYLTLCELKNDLHRDCLASLPASEPSFKKDLKRRRPVKDISEDKLTIVSSDDGKSLKLLESSLEAREIDVISKKSQFSLRVQQCRAPRYPDFEFKWKGQAKCVSIILYPSLAIHNLSYNT
jgi:hypothetical protein